MEAATAAALLNAGTAAGSGILGTGAQLYTNKKNREFEAEQSELQRLWNEKMYNAQNAWNFEMWQKENEYNSPVNQVARLREAGLNPMFYGLDGTGNAQGLTAAQPLGYDRASVGNQLNPVTAGLDIAMKVAQVGNVQADTAKKNNENLTETQRREQIIAETENIKQTLNNLKANQKLTEAEVKQVEKALEWADAVNQATVAEKQASAALNESQKKRIDELLEGEKMLQAKNLEDFDKKWQKIDAEIKKIAAETNLDYLDIKNYSINHMSNGFMGSGLSIQNFARAAADTIEAAHSGVSKAKNWIKSKFSK